MKNPPLLLPSVSLVSNKAVPLDPMAFKPGLVLSRDASIAALQSNALSADKARASALLRDIMNKQTVYVTSSTRIAS